MATQFFKDNETGGIVDENGRDVTDAYNASHGEAAAYGAGSIAHNMAERILPDMSGVPIFGDVLGQLGKPWSQEDAQYIEDLRSSKPISYGAGQMGATIFGPTKGGPLVQGAYGAVQGALTAPRGEAMQGGMLGAGGGILGDIVGRVVGRTYNAFKSLGRPDVAPVADELIERGYKLSPAQKTGKQGYMKIERQFEKTPKGQEIVGDMGKHNEGLLLETANDAIGLPKAPTPIDRNARTLAHEGVVRKMKQAGEGVEIDVPASLSARVSRIIRNDDMLEIPELPDGGTISGRDYMRIRTDLKKAQRGMDPGTGPETYTGKTVQEMDDLFMRIAGDEKASIYRVAREHEKNLITMEKGAALSSDGYINPKSLSNALKSKAGYGPRDVSNALPQTQALIKDLDNISGRTVNPQIGDSGTTDASRNLFDWKQHLQSVGAEKYYSGGMSIPGLLEPAGKRGVALGANVGRAGLLGQRD